MVMNKQTILITGASRGFGFLTARGLARKGHTVFATMRDIDGKNAGAASVLERESECAPGTIYVLEMDVTDEVSVQSAVNSALSFESVIDVAVNNAGVGAIGLAECFTSDQFLQILDVNLIGAQRVNRAVLPIMRRRGSGLLIHISSIVGRLVPPFSGPYAASKFALEALAESYHYELASFGIESIIVEPGSYKTNFDLSKHTPLDKKRVIEYGPMAESVIKIFSHIRNSAVGFNQADPEDVAVAVMRLIETPPGKRPLRTIVGAGMFGQFIEAINRVCIEIEHNWNSRQVK